MKTQEILKTNVECFYNEPKTNNNSSKHQQNQPETREECARMNLLHGFVCMYR